jgi:hypothetical protein
MDSDRHKMGGDVVMVSVERARRNAERFRECVELIEGRIAHKMRPESSGRAAFAGPDGIVDEQHGDHVTVQV